MRCRPKPGGNRSASECELSGCSYFVAHRSLRGNIRQLHGMNFRARIHVVHVVMECVITTSDGNKGIHSGHNMFYRIPNIAKEHEIVDLRRLKNTHYEIVLDAFEP